MAFCSWGVGARTDQRRYPREAWREDALSAGRDLDRHVSAVRAAVVAGVGDGAVRQQQGGAWASGAVHSQYS